MNATRQMVVLEVNCWDGKELICTVPGLMVAIAVTRTPTRRGDFSVILAAAGGPLPRTSVDSPPRLGL